MLRSEYHTSITSLKSDFSELLTRVNLLHNHSLTLENYIDRYECIRIQNMIADTLTAILPPNSQLARKLEFFDSQRMASLYADLFPPPENPLVKPSPKDENQILLDSKSVGDVKRLIAQFNERAKKMVEMEELRSKEREKTMLEIAKLTSSAGVDSQLSRHVDGVKEEAPPILMAPTSLDDGIFMKCDLSALVQTELSSTALEVDPDYELSHIQLIKACKVMMYQLYLLQRRQDFKAEDMLKKLETLEQQAHQVSKQAIDQMSTLVAQVHSDFDSHIKYNAAEHDDLFEKVGTLLQGRGSNAVLKESQASIKRHESVLASLLEYCKLTSLISSEKPTG